MDTRTFLSIAAIASALAVPGLAFAQEEHMISGKVVPVDQVVEVQAKCDELRKAEPAATTPAPSADAATPAPSADAATPAPSADAATPAPSADAATPAPSADAATPAPSADAAAPAAGMAGWTEDGTKIDLTKLTVALCDEGGFIAPAM